MQDRKLRIFFSGIAGSGVSAIAAFMAGKGHIVCGSDRTFDRQPEHPLKNIFKAEGITLVSQDGSGIDESFDLAVFSTAVEAGNPEFIKASSLGIAVRTRPEYLAEITASFSTVAVAGTSGKSTTSGLLAYLMKQLGCEPNFIGGGRVKQFRTPANPGNTLTGNSGQLIIEACESDGTIVNYKPQNTIILNLDLDHHSIENTARMFGTLMLNTADKIIINADDMNLRKITDERAVTFSLRTPSHFKADKIFFTPFGAEFTVRGIPFKLSLPGEYNLYNALAAIAFLAEYGIPLDRTAAVLPDFQGIERRFDIHLNDGERLVIDDYAHNPHKISSLMSAVAQIRESICYIFQPHGFGPTRLMKKEYIAAFSENLRASDHLILLPIYYAGGTASRDISSHDLEVGIRSYGKSVEVMDKREDIFGTLRQYRTYVVLGARDETLSDFAQYIADLLPDRF